MKKSYEKLLIALENGVQVIFDANDGEWDDYSYDGKFIIVKKDGAWVAMYNADHVISVVLK